MFSSFEFDNECFPHCAEDKDETNSNTSIDYFPPLGEDVFDYTDDFVVTVFSDLYMYCCL